MPIAELIEYLATCMNEWGNLPVVIASADGTVHLPVNCVSCFPKSLVAYPGRDKPVEVPVIELRCSNLVQTEPPTTKPTSEKEGKK